MGTRRIICQNELSCLVHLSRRTKVDSSSTRTMHLVPVFILMELNRPTKMFAEARPRRIMRNSSGRIMHLY